MAATNFTPISLYYSATASNVPTAGNLVAGELAINTNDGKLFYKDSSGVVQTLASKAGALGDVVGPASATDNALARFDATTGKLIQNSSVIVDDTGNIGVGVTPNTWTLGKSVSVGDVGSAVFGFGGYSALGSGSYFNSGWKYSSSSSSQKPALFVASDGAFTFSSAAAGTAGNAISFTEVMGITNAGNVGIGTSSPTNYTNQRTLAVNGTTYGRIDLMAGGTVYGSLYGGSSGPTLSTGSALPVMFETNGSERMRIDSSGNLGLGVTGTVGGNTWKFGCVFTSLGLGLACTNGSGNMANFYTSTSTFAGAITSSGSSTTYATSSDYRLKNIIGNLTGYKERIMALQPKQGTWKSDGSEFKGFVAHEFAEQYQTAVTGEKDAVDAEGKPIYQGIQAGGSETIADLVALVQEQQSMIETLTTRLNALEGK
jgi:hypothetical protein